jgi:hypothetical protein
MYRASFVMGTPAFSTHKVNTTEKLMPVASLGKKLCKKKQKKLITAEHSTNV